MKTLAERGLTAIVVDTVDAVVLKELANIDCRTIRQFFKKMIAAELARSMPRSTDTAAEKEGK